MSTIAIIGGTGPQGKGLGYRFALGGHEIIIGSRDEGRAAETAAELDARLAGRGLRLVTGAANAKAADSADLVLLAVPFAGHHELVQDLAPHLADRVVISCVNPLGFDKQGPFGLDLGASSAAEQAQQMLPNSNVVGAFHHLSAISLLGEAVVLDHEDVLVCGDDPASKQVVIDLAATITGKPGIDAGPLRLARQLEPLTAVLISINKRYKVRSGVAIVGLPDHE
jgi:8-hydroxy-5-deazaflavin:NADPH oxidoreductase